MKLNTSFDSRGLGAIQGSIEHFAKLLVHPNVPGNTYQSNLSKFDIEYTCDLLKELLILRHEINLSKIKVKEKTFDPYERLTGRD